MTEKFARLYRRVLRSLNVLDGDMRAMGWEHVRQEFRLHQKITDNKLMGTFTTEWEEFIAALYGSIPPDYKSSAIQFSKDQMERMELLRKELKPDVDDMHRTEK